MSNEQQVAEKIIQDIKDQKQKLTITSYNQFEQYFPINYKLLKKELHKYKINFCIDEKTQNIISFHE